MAALWLVLGIYPFQQFISIMKPQLLRPLRGFWKFSNPAIGIEVVFCLSRTLIPLRSRSHQWPARPCACGVDPKSTVLRYSRCPDEFESRATSPKLCQGPEQCTSTTLSRRRSSPKEGTSLKRMCNDSDDFDQCAHIRLSSTLKGKTHPVPCQTSRTQLLRFRCSGC